MGKRQIEGGGNSGTSSHAAFEKKFFIFSGSRFFFDVVSRLA